MKPIKILIVDDEPDIIHLVTRLLVKEGYIINSTNSGEEALSIISNEKPNIILLDIKLPEIDGYEICRKIRSIKEYNDIIIVLFSVKFHDNDRERGFQAGADYYFIKPFSAKKLLSFIKEISYDIKLENR